MAATDYQSLFTSGVGYAGLPGVSGTMLLKLSLLQIIAQTVAPSMPTDYQSLLSSANVPGYSATSPANLAQVLELALLQIIANNVGSGSGSGATVTSGSGAPTGAAVTGSLYINTVDNTLWDYNGGWNQLL